MYTCKQAIECKIELRQWASDLKVAHISSGILDKEEFGLWTASSQANSHHYGKHGLIIHTHEVVKLCLNNQETFACVNKPVDVQKLFLAALFHDVGKIWDYRCTDNTWTNWECTPHKKLVHHISRSGLEWYKAKNKSEQQGMIPCDFDEEDDVLHAILAHHGVKEYGSPVTPLTRMAWLLHLCDNMSAKMDVPYYK